MIPNQMPPKATKLELGKTYIIVHNYESCELFTFKKKSDLVRMDEWTYYGPIDTTPSLIDLSHFDLSKIEPKKQPDKPGLWAITNRPHGLANLYSFVTEELMNDGRDWGDGEYRFLCDFIPPKQSPVIPPKPENVLHLMRLTKKFGVSDGKEGDMRWCIKNKGGYFMVLKDGYLTGISWLKSQCEPVTE